MDDLPGNELNAEVEAGTGAEGVSATVDTAELQEILMKIQSMVTLVQDLDLLLHVALEDFQIEVEEADRNDISKVKVHLLTYLREFYSTKKY